MRINRFIEDRQTRVAVDIAVDGKIGRLDFDTLKSGGLIKQRQKGLFTVRLKCPGGRVPLERLARIVKVARQYGGDYVHVSVRQSIEIPYVRYENFGAVQSELAEVGQEIASCGPRVRVPSACSGCEYNPNGLTDTQSMAAQVCDRFFAKKPLPHKFKMSFSGCPIDCARTSEMDLAFQGAVRPVWASEACIRCRICEKACLEGAIRCDEETGEPRRDPDQCLYCGDCIRACPTSAWGAETTGWIVRVGGRHGRHPLVGARIAEFVPDSLIPPIIETVLDWYEKAGATQGRVRIGVLLQDESLWRDFLQTLQPILGPYAVANPCPPRHNEIHR
ncbi:MAG: 4Fe-4S binding protein [Candidatus Sumerlaeia bacterium]|nr:4Fe-4S binding protein [Candidatus Sumerlaeia bacterium]